MNINSSDLVDGRPPVVLGLIWTIILYFQVLISTLVWCSSYVIRELCKRAPLYLVCGSCLNIALVSRNVTSTFLSMDTQQHHIFFYTATGIHLYLSALPSRDDKSACRHRDWIKWRDCGLPFTVTGELPIWSRIKQTIPTDLYYSSRFIYSCNFTGNRHTPGLTSARWFQSACRIGNIFFSAGEASATALRVQLILVASQVSYVTLLTVCIPMNKLRSKDRKRVSSETKKARRSWIRRDDRCW